MKIGESDFKNKKSGLLDFVDVGVGVTSVL